MVAAVAQAAEAMDPFNSPRGTVEIRQAMKRSEIPAKKDEQINCYEL
jgi:hypothetical protein